MLLSELSLVTLEISLSPTYHDSYRVSYEGCTERLLSSIGHRSHMINRQVSSNAKKWDIHLILWSLTMWQCLN